MRKETILRIVAFLMAAMLCLSVAATALAYDTIPYGEQSNDVRKMQDKLKAKGFYKGAIDGKFGPGTKQAVIRFQNSVGIKADGKPGHKTLTALYEGKSALNGTYNSERRNATQPKDPQTLYYGCTGSRVKSLQRALREVGCYKGAIDGIYGDLTYAAVKRYQSQKGLRADGMAGKRTLASLNKNADTTVRSSFLLAYGSESEEVKEMIRYLGSKGYDVPASGKVFDKQMEAAVKAWQSDTGKTVTGTISESQYNRIVLGKE